MLTSIKLLNDKDNILDRNFLIKDKVKGVGKNGRTFLSLLIGDKTGHIDARVWDRADEIAEIFDIGDIVTIKGQVQVYQNRKQIVVHKLEKPDQLLFVKEDYTIEDIKIDTHALYSELVVMVNEVSSTHIKQLILESIQDEEIKKILLINPAAKSIHHAKAGGLIEHVVSICKIMKMLSKNYPQLSEDLLIFGAIFHDIGKIWELEIIRDQIQYTQNGRFLGHMQLACELIDKKSQRILGFPEDLKVILKHLVLSHHGKLEFGSPVRPYIPEAYVVSAVDEMDSKLDSMFKFIQIERETGNSWSRYSEHFDRYFYLEDLKGRWE